MKLERGEMENIYSVSLGPNLIIHWSALQVDCTASLVSQEAGDGDGVTSDHWLQLR